MLTKEQCEELKGKLRSLVTVADNLYYDSEDTMGIKCLKSDAEEILQWVEAHDAV